MPSRRIPDAIQPSSLCPLPLRLPPLPQPTDTARDRAIVAAVRDDLAARTDAEFAQRWAATVAASPALLLIYGDSMSDAQPARHAAGLVQCWVSGAPAPQGSKRHVGHGRMVESSQQLPDWRTAVALQVRAAMRAGNHPGFTRTQPVGLRLEYRLRRPESAPKRVRLPVRRPDLDKLIRATLDALSVCGLIADDAQVWTLQVRKVYAPAGSDTGMRLWGWADG